MRKVLNCLYISLLAVMLSLNYLLFIFPNSFVPAGIDGICTMIMDLSGINIGYLSLIVNIPLLIFAYKVLNKEFSFYTAVFILVFSFSSLFFKHFGISKYGYHTLNGTSIVLSPVVAGVIRGIIYVFTLKINCCGGGVDLIGAITKKYRPHLDLMYIIFVFNTMVAGCAFFVYGMEFEPVVCSIIYFFISGLVSGIIRSSKNEIIRFEIITDDASKLCTQINEVFHQQATVVESHGSYSGKSNNIVICVTDKVTAPKIEKAIQAYPGSVTFKSVVNNSKNSHTDYL